MLAVLKGHPWGSRGLAARGHNLMKLIMDNQRLDQELLRHLYACVELSRGHTNFTFAHDKANVGGPHLLNTVVVLDTNLAMLQCPQVETRKALAMQPSDRRAFCGMPISATSSGNSKLPQNTPLLITTRNTPKTVDPCKSFVYHQKPHFLITTRNNISIFMVAKLLVVIGSGQLQQKTTLFYH